MGIFSQQLETNITPIAAQNANEGAGTSIARLAGTFFSPTTKAAAPSADEKFSAQWKEFTDIIKSPGLSLQDATAEQLSKFQGRFTGSDIYKRAEDAHNADALELNNQEDAGAAIFLAQEKAFQSSVEYSIANAKAAQGNPTPEVRANIMAEARANFTLTQNRINDIKQQVDLIGLDNFNRAEIFNTHTTKTTDFVNVFSGAISDAVGAISKDPTAKINLGEIGIGAIIPSLASTVLTKDNMEAVLIEARAGLLKYSLGQVASSVGKTVDDLGNDYAAWETKVFKQFDVTSAWAIKNVSADEIKKRSDSRFTAELLKAGINLQYIEQLKGIAYGDPTLSKAILGPFTGVVGQVTEYMASGEHTKAVEFLKAESQVKVYEARAGFASIVRMYNGTDANISTYPEVSVNAKDAMVTNSILGMFAANYQVSLNKGKREVLDQAVFAEVITASAGSISRIANVDPEFKSRIVSSIANDISFSFDFVKQKAVGAGVNVDMSKEGTIVYTPNTPVLFKTGAVYSPDAIETLSSQADSNNTAATEKLRVYNSLPYITNNVFNFEAYLAYALPPTELSKAIEYKWQSLDSLQGIGTSVRKAVSDTVVLGASEAVATTPKVSVTPANEVGLGTTIVPSTLPPLGVETITTSAGAAIEGAGAFKKTFGRQEDSLVGDQGLIRVSNSDAMTRELQAKLSNAAVSPTEAFHFNTKEELDFAIKNGLLDAGVVFVLGAGSGAQIYVAK